MSRRASKQSGSAGGQKHPRGRTRPVRARPTGAFARRHLLFGWWALFAFLSLGLLLEGFHGFKTDAYLGADSESRRLLFTLAHAHGTLLALINLSFAFLFHVRSFRTVGVRELTSRTLVAATLLLPLGFFLGGAFLHRGEPGLGALLVPLGALLLGLGVALCARNAGRALR